MLYRDFLWSKYVPLGGKYIFHGDEFTSSVKKTVHEYTASIIPGSSLSMSLNLNSLS